MYIFQYICPLRSFILNYCRQNPPHNKCCLFRNAVWTTSVHTKRPPVHDTKPAKCTSSFVRYLYYDIQPIFLALFGITLVWFPDVVSLFLCGIIFVWEEIKSRLKSGNACYRSVQNLLSSNFLSKNLRINIFRTIILPVVVYGCETWSLILRKERRLRFLRIRCWGEYLGLRGTR